MRATVPATLLAVAAAATAAATGTPHRHPRQRPWGAGGPVRGSGGGLRYSFWAEGPVNGGCSGWGMPYPGFSAAAKLQPSCWNNTLTLVAEHAALIDELDLSVGFQITNVSNGLFDLDIDGSAWAPGFRVKPLDWLPHWIPELRAALRPETRIVVPFGFEENATRVARMAYRNADALAAQMVQLASAHDWIDGYILDYERDCGDYHAAQDATCVPKEAKLLTKFFKTLATALHAANKTLGFATNKNGAGFEHWPYYSGYLAAGVDRLYEMCAPQPSPPPSPHTI